MPKTWNLNEDYFCLDGSTKTEKRLKWSTTFNDPKNPRARLFLTSTKAGSIGINLKGANRVIIFDASWNPSLDEQSVFRVYRYNLIKLLPFSIKRTFKPSSLYVSVYMYSKCIEKARV